ncbi:hypothetical protein PENSOL_c042G00427 [Penicillium solitum]|uniref:Uncharacterized protein n=1 Tax=Penicillium solitum TaxID=60172 RepID=A0A1V6QSU9_9EURO|nr:uncharacterized protein PENSOL_c042G00427 [Penicillium solitum]OQD92298.1 hypothetical protein PENSOL_c042G00427 [Penicillium solitum]
MASDINGNGLGTPWPPETPEYLALHSSLTSSLEDLQRLVDGSLRTFVCHETDLAAF